MPETPDDDSPLYNLDALPPELLTAIEGLPRRILHYGMLGAVCGAQVPAGQRTDITALVSCQHCLALVPPPARGHWAVVYGPRMEEP